MRIRKRKVPLPLSLLSPVPLSDPHLFGRSPVVVQQRDHDHHHILDTNLTTATTSQPSDRVDPTSSMTSASDLRRSIEILQPPMPCLSFEENERKEEIIDARQDVLALSNAMGAKSWDDHTNVSISSQDKPILVKKRPRTTTVGPTSEVEDQEEVEEDGKDKNAHEGGGKKSGGGGGGGSKVRRGNTIMEGSRCSRVNGRGWRCCQPTLVGYSLCEHHLGKGRLRSMTSVRGRPSLFNKEAVVVAQAPQPPPSEAKSGESGIMANQAAVMVSSSAGKRAKLGVVKARSLSSLLGQAASASNDIHNCPEQVETNGDISINDGNEVVNEGV